VAGFWFPILLFLLPIYVTNASAMVFGGKTPLDLNIIWRDGRPILGKGKTFQGTFFGVFFGTLTALLLWAIFPLQTAEMTGNFVAFGFLISLGAVIGDLVKSFIKRRLGKKSGEEFLLADQLDFVIGALVFGWVFFAPTALQILVMILATIVVHRIANWIAFKTKLKTVPW